MMARRTRCAVMLWLGMMSTAAADNNVHFPGQLVADVCQLVVNGNTLAEVVFSPVSAADLTIRRQSAHIPFTLQLKDCKTTLSDGVKVKFSGTTASGMNGFLALDAASNAGGIAIGIETAAGTQVEVNGATGAELTLNNGLNTLSFNAWIQARDGDVITPGTFSATANVAFEYL